MKILILTGVLPPAVGGPAKYAKNLAAEFARAGASVQVVGYRPWQQRLPSGLRHLVFFLYIIPAVRRTDVVLALDTFSVGVPAAAARLLFSAKLVARIGGDFLWEQFVERTGQELSLPAFYEAVPKLNLKEKIIFRLTKFLLNRADKLVFTTDWQKRLWTRPYGLKESGRTTVIENYSGKKRPVIAPERKNYLMAARALKLKNRIKLREAFNLAKQRFPEIELEELPPTTPEALAEKIARCYAVLVPSWSEVSPNLVLEAIEFGKPFILTKYSGYVEGLKEVGCLVDPFSVADLEAQISFLAEPKNYQAAAARLGAFDRGRSWRGMAQDYLKLFSAL